MNVYELIPGKLWQSGILGEYEAPKVDMIIDCTHDMDLRGAMADLYVHVPFKDAPLDAQAEEDPMLKPRLLSVAALGAKMISIGARVLTHCTAGINRSSLMDGMILLALRANGMQVDGNVNVVGYIRSRRLGALTNFSFVDFLEELERK